MMDFFLNSKFVISSQNSTFGRKMATFMFTFVQIWDNYKPNLITTPLSLSWAILFTIYLTTENCTTSVYSSWEAFYQVTGLYCVQLRATMNVIIQKIIIYVHVDS